MHVGIGHVNLGTQHHGTLFNFTTVHLLEEFQVLLNRTVAVGAIDTRLRRCTLLLGNLLRGLFVDVGFALLDQLDGKLPQLGEVV